MALTLPPQATELARWLGNSKTQADLGEKALNAFAALDWGRLDLKHPPPRIGASRNRQRAIRHVQERLRDAAPLLREVMCIGLQMALGGPVRSSVFIALRARGFSVAGISVCEDCHLVFESPRQAIRCQRCCHRPPRHKLYATCEGGWHRSARLQESAYANSEGPPSFREVLFEAVCTACGAEFQATRAEKHLCGSCGSGAGRKRRHDRSRRAA